MYSIVIPYLSNSTTIEKCLSYLEKNSKYDHEIVHIKDESDVYFAFNKGVYHSKNETVVLMNDDMIVSKNWDELVVKESKPDVILTMNVVEANPGKMANGPECIPCDCGDVDSFDYNKFENFIKIHSSNIPDVIENCLGWYMPTVVNQKTFVSYPNIQKFPLPNDITAFHHIYPFVGFKYKMIKSYVYHFSGIARKKVYKD
jgi:hypothetical protein